jgi:hypothetical protein
LVFGREERAYAGAEAGRIMLAGDSMAEKKMAKEKPAGCWDSLECL